MGDSAGRGRLTASRVTAKYPAPATHLARDFRIQDEQQVGAGSLAHKLQGNLQALRTLRQLEAEHRLPAPGEAVLLVRYVGWGALSKVFQRPSYPFSCSTGSPEESAWQLAGQELRDLLSEEEYQSAQASTLNAHYTSLEVIRFVWKVLLRLGFTAGGQILEPSLGVGHFFGLMPEDLLPGTHRTGVEIDSVSARIAQKLYPDSTILHSPFEKTHIPDQFYDLVIGNVPFGHVAVFDPAYRRKPQFCRSLHDYFLVKSLDKLRSGGLLAVLTSRYSLDKKETAVRRHLASQAHLIQTFRLPNTAFQQNAGTTVVTDLLILQKR